MIKDGIIVINKGKGITSHDVVSIARKKLNTKAIGHTGTLDPIATGVLVLCIGKATKLVDYLMAEEKEYIVTMKLGIETDTYDITGNVLREEKDIDKIKEVTDKKIKKTVNQFIGKQKQLPPIYSAIKVDGKKLYEYARQGKEVEVKQRDIDIYSIAIQKIDRVNQIIELKVACSKGTYIRSLCHDIGIKLGVGATMIELIRTKNGEFAIEDSIEVDDIEQGRIIDTETVCNKYEKQEINDIELQMFLNGIKIKTIAKTKLVRIYSSENSHNNFVGVAINDNGFIKRLIVL